MSKRISFGWFVLAAGFAVMIVGYAMRNSFTVFYPVIVSDFGWSRGITAIMYSITLLCYGFVAPVAGGLVDRFDPRIVLSIGGLVVGGGMALCSVTTETWHFYLFYGVMVATGLSLIGMTPLSTIITDWFPRHRGMVFGLLGSGFGVSLVSAPAFQYLIFRFGWQIAYVVLGAIAAALIVPLALIFMKRHRESTGNSAVAHREAIDATKDQLIDSQRDWSLRKALKTNTYRVFLLICICNMGVAQQMVIAHEVYFLQDIGYTPMSAATIFGVFGLCLAIGNLASSLSDRFGRTSVFIAACVLSATSIGLLMLMRDGSASTIPYVLAGSSGWGLGMAAPTCFAAVADRFHGRDYGSIQGMIILACSTGGAVGPWLGGMLHDVTGNYDVALTIAVAFIAASAVLMWLIRPGHGDVPA